MRSFFGATRAAVTVAALLIGLSHAEAAQTVRVFTGSTAHWADLVIAMKKGYFAAEGVTVEPTYFTTGAAATESFLAGRGDVVLTCELASLGMWKRGSVVGISRQAKLFDQEYLVVRGEIAVPADLEGKTLATRFGSTVEYFLRKYIVDEKLNADRIKIINLEPADMVAALDSGDIQGYSNYIPFPQLSMRATKSAKVLATSGKYIQENCIYSATKTFARGNRAELVAFLRGIRAADDHVGKNVDDAAKAVSEEFKGSVANMKLVIENMKFEIGYDRDFRTNMQRVADFFKGGEINWAEWFDPSVLKEVAPASVQAD